MMEGRPEAPWSNLKQCPLCRWIPEPRLGRVFPRGKSNEDR